jgi:hypothetical protein
LNTKKDLRDEIVRLLYTNLSQTKKDQLQKILNILESGKIYDEMVSILIELEIPEHVSKMIVDHLILHNTDVIDVMRCTINSPLVLEDLMGKRSDMTELLAPHGISKETVDWLTSYKWSSTPASGMGELAFSMFVKGARKGRFNEHGDVMVGDVKVEVKGKEARLMGQRGYGDAPSVGAYMRKKFMALKRKHSLDIELPKDQIHYNFYKSKSKPWLIESVTRALYDQGDEDPMVAVKIASEALTLLYVESTKDEIFTWMSKHVNEVGAFDRDGFVNDFLQFSLEYYQKLEGFDYLVLFNRSQFMLMDPKDMKHHLDEIRFACPSFNTRAGMQGKAFSVTLKLRK